MDTVTVVVAAGAAAGAAACKDVHHGLVVLAELEIRSCCV